MVHKNLVFVLILFMSFSAQAFELIMVQAVSDSKQTFITRNGKRQGHIQGMTGTFTAEDISILAKAITVTGNFTQWEILNKGSQLPFEKGQIVTYYPATEYIWALAPESERRKYIKSELNLLRKSWVSRVPLQEVYQSQYQMLRPQPAIVVATLVKSILKKDSTKICLSILVSDMKEKL